MKKEFTLENFKFIKPVVIDNGYLQNGKVDINYSSTLTKLIQEAGRWCENWASDLFITWKYNVDIPCENGTLESKSLLFGFRQCGVDHADYIFSRYNDNPYTEEYRSIWRLDIAVNDGKVTFKLGRVK